MELRDRAGWGTTPLSFQPGRSGSWFVAFLPCLVTGAVRECLLLLCQPVQDNVAEWLLEGQIWKTFALKEIEKKKGKALLLRHAVLASLLASLMITERQQCGISWRGGCVNPQRAGLLALRWTRSLLIRTLTLVSNSCYTCQSVLELNRENSKLGRPRGWGT